MRFFNSTSDLGLGFKHFKGEKRIINKDGSFNVRREGLESFSRNLYQDLIKMRWVQFFALIFILLLLINFIFAVVYFFIGIGSFSGVTEKHWFWQFLQLFYFSFQTFTTVGYGHISPATQAAGLVSSLEAICGLSSFAIITGLLYGRFSKPIALLEYSKNALIAPYHGINSFQFRIANKRNSIIMELNAQVLMMSLHKENGKLDRRFEILELERKSIVFFPLNWTIVHPIDEKSPLFGWDEKKMRESEVEFIILIKGYDDTFGDFVYSRYSYKANEVEWNARFEPAFESDDDGDLVLYLDKISDYNKL